MAEDKVRFVRCPKCLKVLPERADVPMYTCGGCGTVLQAKIRNSSNLNGSSAPESSTSQSEIKTEDFRLTDTSKESPDSVIRKFVSEENPDTTHPISTILGSDQDEVKTSEEVLEKKHVRSSTVSSSDDRSNKYRQMSRRTVRSKEGGDGLSRSSTVKAEADIRGMSLKSEAFYSVNSWVASEKEEGPSRSLSRRSAFSSDNNRSLELLKLVEKMRDELSGKKQISYQYPQQNRPSFHDDSSSSQNSRHKTRTNKSFCRPVFGGAPFVVCNKCFEILRMPADFLNKLKCGTCSETMVLSFPARVFEVSRRCRKAGKNQEDPISLSEDYRVSFADDSSSIETEAKLNVSRGSTRDSDSANSKASLHRLMGYPSARQLLL